MIDPTAFVHPKAHVEDAEVGARTKVWQFASVIRGAHLGEDCTVASCATLDGCWFGNRCIVSQGVAAGPGFLIGDDVFIGPNVTLCNDAWPAAHKEGFDAWSLRHGGLTIKIYDGAAIGANAVLLPGIVIHAGAMIAAGAVAKHDLPPNTVLFRNGDMTRITPTMRVKRMRLLA